ncbi:hypothetical protein F5882DRAFT_487080 [Hyaloscypha sp. PMI_1271]|nr:hypothetical protein F5882DRAFT_487080 [Hyaloscypha sp. PMI_1271]
MARGNNKVKHKVRSNREKRKGKNKDRNGKRKGRQMKISSWVGRSSSPELCPDPDDLKEKNARGNLRWIHAGVHLDAQSKARDIWYSFKELKNGSHRIIYSPNSTGSFHGNYNVGQIKRNLITFDDHHSRNWIHFLNQKGTWTYRNAKRGRRCQRQTLLETFLDPTFVDPYPHGKDHKSIGPRLNVIHYIDDKSGPYRGRGHRSSGSASPAFTPPGQCYPSTNIPLSAERIKFSAFKDINPNAIKIISDFLTGNIHYHPSDHLQRRRQLDYIESAFFDQGHRVDRAAIDHALDVMEEPGSNAFESNVFIQNLPLRVDQYKGNEVEELIQRVGGKDPDSGGRLDSDDDSEGDRGDDSGDDDDDPDSLFVGRHPKSKRSGPGPGPGGPKFSPKFRQDLVRLTAGRKNSNSQEYDSDGLDYLPDDSPLKGKGPAMRKRASQAVTKVQKEIIIQEIIEVKDEVQDNDHIEVDEDRSTPAPLSKRVKSEPPIFQSSQDNPVVINEDPSFEDDSDVEFIEERVRTKREPFDNIIIDMTMEDN